jgi:hypothetical protein
MARPIERIIRNGDRFGRLTVMRKAGPLRGLRRYRCECDCGRQTTVLAKRLYTGDTRSCGCLHRELAEERLPEAQVAHGHARKASWSGTYGSWRAMIGRCTYQSNAGYENYGGRGIAVCDRWRESFEAFLTDMGERPGPHYELDRVDSDGDYEPGNVRWATRSENQRNKRPHTGLVARDSREDRHP